jgi:glutamyl/glutaminyl-tRNA synthetase
VFDEAKLEWLNAQYINALEPEAIETRVRADFERAGLWSDAIAPGGARRDWFLEVLALLKARSRLLPDFARDARPFLSEEFGYRDDAIEKHIAGARGGAAAAAARLRALRAVFEDLTPFDEASAEAGLRSLAEQRGEPAAQFIHPLRVALVGVAVSPSVFAVLRLIGRERALVRLDRLATYADRLPAAAAGAGDAAGRPSASVDTSGSDR